MINKHIVVEIKFAEGPREITDALPVFFTEWAEADQWFDNLAKHLEPESGCYKTEIEITLDQEPTETLTGYEVRRDVYSNLEEYVSEAIWGEPVER